MSNKDLMDQLREMLAEKEKHAKTCPSCGHCPTCGRNAQPSYPYPIWVYPHWQQPYWYSTGAIQGNNTGLAYGNIANTGVTIASQWTTASQANVPYTLTSTNPNAGPRD